MNINTEKFLQYHPTAIKQHCQNNNKT